MSKQEQIEAVTRILKQQYPDKNHPEIVADEIIWRLGVLKSKES